MAKKTSQEILASVGISTGNGQASTTQQPQPSERSSSILNAVGIGGTGTPQMSQISERSSGILAAVGIEKESNVPKWYGRKFGLDTSQYYMDADEVAALNEQRAAGLDYLRSRKNQRVIGDEQKVNEEALALLQGAMTELDSTRKSGGSSEDWYAAVLEQQQSAKAAEDEAYNRWRSLTQGGGTWDASGNYLGGESSMEERNAAKAAYDEAKNNRINHDYMLRMAESMRYDDLFVASDPISRSKMQAGKQAFEADKAARDAASEADSREAMFLRAIEADMGSNNVAQEMLRAYRADNSWREPQDDWTEDQLNTFYLLYERDKEEAYAYAQGLNDYNAAMAAYEKQQKAAAWATKPGIAGFGTGLAASAYSIITAPLGFADFISDTMEATARGTVTQKDFLSLSDYGDVMTAAIASSLNNDPNIFNELLGKLSPVTGEFGLGDVYQMGMSALQSWTYAQVLGPAATLAYFGIGAKSGFDSAMARGGTPAQAFLSGVVGGGIEMLTEKYSIENIISSRNSAGFKNAIINVLRQGGVEASEEVLSMIGNTIADGIIMGDLSEYNQKVESYILSGLSDTDARKQAAKEWMQEAAYTIITSFGSGAMTGGVQAGVQNIARYGGDSQTLINRSLEAEKGSAERLTAERYQEILDKATKKQEKKAEGDRKPVRLSAAQAANLEELHGEAQVDAALKTAGIEDKTVKKAIMKLMSGDSLTKAERRALVQTEGAMEAAEKLMGIEPAVKAAAAPESSEEALSEDIPGESTQPIESAEEQPAEPVRGRKNAKAEVNGKAEAVEGIRYEEGKLQIKTESGWHSEAEVSLAPATQVLVDAVSRYKADAGVMFAAYQDGQDVKKFVEAWKTAENALGAGSMATIEQARKVISPHDLTDEQLKVAFGKGRDRKTELDRKAAAKAPQAAYKDRKGSVSYDGGVVDGKEYKAVNKENLTRAQLNQIEVIQKLAEVFRINFVLYESEAGEDGKFKGASGIYWNNTIYIDVNAGLREASDKEALGKVAIIRTAAHELTHWMQENNRQGYAKLKDFALRTLLEKKKMSVNDLIIEKQNRAKGKLSEDDAMDEIVADGCEMMLQDSKIMEKLAKEDKNLARQIGEWLKDWTKKLRRVFNSVSAYHKEAKALEEYANQMREIWEEGFLGAAAVTYEGDINGRSTEQSTKPGTERRRHDEGKPVSKAQRNVEQRGRGLFGRKKPQQLEDGRYGLVIDEGERIFGDKFAPGSYELTKLNKRDKFVKDFIERETGYPAVLVVGGPLSKSGNPVHGIHHNGIGTTVDMSEPDSVNTAVHETLHGKFALANSDQKAREKTEKVFYKTQKAAQDAGYGDDFEYLRKYIHKMNYEEYSYGGKLREQAIPKMMEEVILAIAAGNLDDIETCSISGMQEFARQALIEEGVVGEKFFDFFTEYEKRFGRDMLRVLEPDIVDAAQRALAESVKRSQAEGDAIFAKWNAEQATRQGEELQENKESVVVTEDGEPVAYTDGNGSAKFSLITYEEEGRTALHKYLEKRVKAGKITETEMQEMIDGIEEIYRTCQEFKDKYAPFGTWSEAKVVEDSRGRAVFSVVTPNGEYKMNIDFSLVCKKRRALDAVFNEMSRRGIIDDFELGQKSIVKINEIIRKFDFETACALCFVDARRFRQANAADSFVDLYNDLVLSLVPEEKRGQIAHFNFAGNTTIENMENGIDTWDKSQLDFSHIDHVLATYGKNTVEHKASKYIKESPEARRLLQRGDFMSSAGFDAVKIRNERILKLYNSKKGTGGPKAAFGDVQYLNEILKNPRTWTPAKAFAVGGVRIQSFSDYIARMVFDYVQMVYDLAAATLPAHAYTKETMFVKQFGLTGIKINMSLIPAIADDGIAPGLDANGNYVWAGESFNFEEAKRIQNADGYSENCGTICVGVSYAHIRKLLADPDIRMVIPYHKSGLNPIIAHMNKIGKFKNYESNQHTKGPDGENLKHDYDFSGILHKGGANADPKAAADEYLAWCDKNGYTPKFSEFRGEEGYYKLLIDFTVYDKNGKYVPQRAVKAVFPKDGAPFGSMKKLIDEGLEEDAIIEGRRIEALPKIIDEIVKTLPRHEADIEEVEVPQADRDLEARYSEERGEIKYSDRDDGLDNKRKKKYNKHKARNETETLFLSWSHGSAPVGEVKRFYRFKKIHYYEKTETGCVELSKKQYEERMRYNGQNTYRSSKSRFSGDTDSNGSPGRNRSGNPDSDRNPGRSPAVLGQALTEKLQGDTGRSVPDGRRNDRRNTIDDNFSTPEDSQFSERDLMPDERELLLTQASMPGASDELKKFRRKYMEADRLNRRLENLTSQLNEEGADKDALQSEIEKTEAALIKAEESLRKYEASAPMQREAERAIADWRSQNDLTAAKLVRRLNEDNERLRRRVEYLQEEMKLSTGTPKADPEDVRKMARSLVEEYGSRLGIDYLTTQLQNLADYIVKNDSGLNSNMINNLARTIARDVLRNAHVEPDTQSSGYDGLRKYLRESKLQISDELRRDAPEGIGKLRKSLFGKIELVNEGMDISIAYGELQEFMGEAYFPDDITTHYEMVQQMADVLRMLEPKPEPKYTKTEEAELTVLLATDIVDRVLSPEIGQRKTLADKQFQRLVDRAVKQDEYIQMLRGVVNRQEWKKRAEISAKVHELRERSINREKAYKARKRVEKKANRLFKTLKENSGKNHVPDSMKGALAAYLSALSPLTKRSDEDTRKEYFQRLSELELIMVKYLAEKPEGDEFTEDDLTPLLQKILGDHKGEFIKTMNVEQSGLVSLAELDYEQLKTIEKILQLIDRSFEEDRDQRLAGEGKISEQVYKSKEYLDPMAGEVKRSGLRKFLKWTNLQPTFFFKRLGPGGEEMYKALQEGWSRFAYRVQEVIKFAEETYKTAYADAAEKQIITVQLHRRLDDTKEEIKEREKGKEVPARASEDKETVRMTKAQLMSIYALSLREAAKDHLFGYGIKIAPFKEKAHEVEQAARYLISQQELGEIVAKYLDDEDIKVVLALVQYMSSTGSSWGNEVTQKRWEIDFFDEKNYFPMQTDENSRDVRSPEAKRANLFLLSNQGFTKKLTPNAKNALVISSVFDVFANHMTDMAKYSTLAMPAIDVMRFWNYRGDVQESEDGQSTMFDLRQTIKEVYGQEAESYFTTLMADLNGNVEGGRGEDFASKFTSGYKIAAVGANLRVALLQPTSIVRASFVLPAKYISRAVLSNAGELKRIKEEMWKYSGEATWKKLGFRDVNLNANVRELIKHTSSAFDTAREVSMKPAELMDEWTWAQLWKACKLEAKEKTGLEGEELLKATAERFREVVYKTQVWDSTLTKSQLMRSNQAFPKMITSFMSEPVLSYNLLLDTYSEVEAESRRTSWGEAWKKNKGKVAKAFAVYTASTAAAALMGALADAFRDDDEYQNFVEKFLEHYGDNFFDEINPLDKIPLIRDVVDTLSHESVSRTDMTVFQQIAKTWEINKESIQLARGVIDEPTETTYYGRLTTWGIIYENLKAVSQITGLPIASLTRDVSAIWNTLIGQRTGLVIKTYDAGPKNNIRYAFQDGYLTEEEAVKELVETGVSEDEEEAYWMVQEWATGESKYANLREAVMSGDTLAVEQEIEALKEHGVRSGTSESEVRKAIKAGYQGSDGESKSISKTDAVTMLMDMTGMNEMDAKKTVQEWTCWIVEGIEYSELKEAYIDGEISKSEAERMKELYGSMDADKAATEVLKWQCEKDTGIPYDSIKEEFINEELSSEQVVKLLTKYGGETEEKAEEDMLKWKSERDTGIAVEDIQAFYDAGEISAEEVLRMQTEYNGKTEEEAEALLAKYDFVDGNYALNDISNSAVAGYNEHVRDTGISSSDFYTYWKAMNSYEGEKDEEGNTIRNSKKDQILAYINSLPLTVAQKDALYRFNDWSEGNLRNAPWH